ncbi:hypothetical protein AVEN_230451-1 [Araneus ventricosus]|uniref:Uncharacterized protein n=1 Tax=Araneus ventricosus TaxID=182803 RepID=A0A4Y2KQJ4_ARAVE|nr:hypothetical protein AVEN_230451-1 [Araneus ventricosus]
MMACFNRIMPHVMCPKLSVHGSRSMMKNSSYYPDLQIPQILTFAKICGNISIDTSDPPPRNLHKLRDALLFSWSQMPVATFQAHTESMTRRLTV